MAQPTTLLGITTDRMDMLIMLGRNGGTDTGHVATGGIIEIRIAEASHFGPDLLRLSPRRQVYSAGAMQTALLMQHK
jgi:hypothetical protein